jgi:hypothetical protein
LGFPDILYTINDKKKIYLDYETFNLITAAYAKTIGNVRSNNDILQYFPALKVDTRLDIGYDTYNYNTHNII